MIIRTLPFLVALQIGTSASDLSLSGKIVGGGGVNNSGRYTLAGTIGEIEANGTSGRYSLKGHIFVEPVLIQTPGAPLLRSFLRNNSFVISFEGSTNDFILEARENYGNQSWGSLNAPTVFANGTTTITVHADRTRRFFRVRSR